MSVQQYRITTKLTKGHNYYMKNKCNELFSRNFKRITRKHKN